MRKHNFRGVPGSILTSLDIVRRESPTEVRVIQHLEPSVTPRSADDLKSLHRDTVFQSFTDEKYIYFRTKKS